MRRLEAHLFAVLVAVTAGCSCAEAPAPASFHAESATITRATLRAVQGDVTVKKAAGDEWIAAADAMALYENDKLRTARGASAVVRFVNGSQLTVGEDALVGIAEARTRPGAEPSDVTVLKGRVDAELSDPKSQSLVVTTPSAMVRAGREIVFQ